MSKLSKEQLQTALDEAVEKLLWTRSQLVDAQTQLRRLQWELTRLTERINGDGDTAR